MAALRPVPIGDCVVRAARADDGPALYAAWQRARQHNAAADRRIIPAPVPAEEFKAEFEQSLARSESVTFVAERAGRFAGFISGGIERNPPDRLPPAHATIGYLYVDESHRRRGVARALFGAVAGWANQRGEISHFEMAVISSDETAAAFWRAIGFTPFISRLWAPLSAGESPE